MSTASVLPMHEFLSRPGLWLLVYITHAVASETLAHVVGNVFAAIGTLSGAA